VSVPPPPGLSSKILIFLISVCAKIRDSTDGYSASNDYWLRCLYEDEKGDLEDVEKGFLKSTLLVKVYLTCYSMCELLMHHSLNRPSR